MKSTLKFRAALSLAALAVVQVAIPKTASAAVATDTWNGSTNATWTAVGSWTSGNDPPQTGDSLFFTGTTAGTNSVDNDSGLSINNLTFNSGSKSFTLSSSNGTNPSTLTITGGVIDNATKAQTIGSGTTGLILSGSGSVTLNAGSLTLDGTNTYTGTTTVAAGTLFGSAAYAFGSGGLTVNGGKAELDGFNETVAFLEGSGGSITDAGTLTFGGSGTYTYSGTISDGTNPPLTLVDNNTGTQIFNAKLSYTGTTTINDGTLQISGANTETLSGGISGGGYLTIGDGATATVLTVFGTLNNSETTTINNASTLILGATAIFSSPLVDVESGGTFDISKVTGGITLGSSVAQTLEGSGSVKVSATGKLTVGGNGTLSPGVPSTDTIGTLSVNGSVTLNGNFSTQVDPDNDESPPNDQLDSSGKVVLGGTLNVTTSNSDPLYAGDSYTLINATSGITGGSFGAVNLPALNSGLSWDITMMNNLASNYQNNYAASVINTPGGAIPNAPFYSASLNMGQSYKGYYIQNPGGRQTQVQFLDGTVSTTTSPTVQFGTAPAGNTDLISDVVRVSGTNSDMYVLELSYNSAAVTNGTLSPVLAVYNPVNEEYETAVLFNLSDSVHQEVTGAYTSSDFVLGDYGVDPTNHEVWAVLNYSGGNYFGIYQRIPGDLTGAGTVTLSDLSLVQSNLNLTTNGLWSDDDFHGSGAPTDLDSLTDLSLAQNNLNATEPMGNAFQNGVLLFHTAVVPEPGSLALLVLGGLGMTLGRRRKKRSSRAN